MTTNENLVSPDGSASSSVGYGWFWQAGPMSCTACFVAPRRMDVSQRILMAVAGARLQGENITTEAEQLVVRLFHAEGRSLVRLARLFVDDRETGSRTISSKRCSRGGCS